MRADQNSKHEAVTRVTRPMFSGAIYQIQRSEARCDAVGPIGGSRDMRGSWGGHISNCLQFTVFEDQYTPPHHCINEGKIWRGKVNPRGCTGALSGL